LLQYYARQLGHRRGEFPAAESIGDRTISLPCYPQLTGRQIRRVIDVVGSAVAATEPVAGRA
jgi:dTDP-4-amino-4,6-dideoxygalactose transaminase